MPQIELSTEDIDTLETVELNYPNISTKEHDAVLSIIRDIIEQANPNDIRKQQFRR